MPGKSIPFSIILIFALACTRAMGDELLYRYEADVVPYDELAGWLNGLCEGPCSESLQDGHFILTWSGGGDSVNYHLWISVDPITDPPPPSLWVEWRFRSDQALGPIFFRRDGSFKVRFRQMTDSINMYGDAVISNEGGDFVTGLDINEFHTYRFESPDGLNYTFAVDGKVFLEDTGSQVITNSFLQMHGTGGEDGFAVNEWDFVRYGTISEGEAIVSSNPPEGTVESQLYPTFDRFTITFDQPGYVYIDDVIVETTGGEILHIIQTRRLDNGDPETVQIVLDRPLASDETATFTFNTGGTPNTVTYTYRFTGGCCLPDGTCMVTTNEQCVDLNGEFSSGGICTEPLPCCLENDACLMLIPRCCRFIEGTIITTGEVCDGDRDMDDVDSACGDNCPNDPFKMTPGICGCGKSDVDSDFDTVPDCIDQCPGEDDRIDDNNNGTPDCAEDIVIIPTVSQWGMVILILALMIAVKLSFGYQLKLD